MKSMKCQTSFCSRCQHYTPEGRRGGQCGLLGAPVRGGWKACSLAIPAFFTQLSTPESLEILLHSQDVDLQKVIAEEKQTLEAIYSS